MRRRRSADPRVTPALARPRATWSPKLATENKELMGLEADEASVRYQDSFRIPVGSSRLTFRTG